jgi:hypothetical protein
LAGLVSMAVSPMTSECSARQYIRNSGSRAAYEYLRVEQDLSLHTSPPATEICLDGKCIRQVNTGVGKAARPIRFIAPARSSGSD